MQLKTRICAEQFRAEGKAALSERIPTYRKKRTKTCIYAIDTLPDGLGGRRDVLLGKYGSAASRQEYARVIAEWEAAGPKLPAKDSRIPDLTIAELIARYWPWVESYYRRPEGTPTKETSAILYSLRPLNHLHGRKPAKDFGPIALKAVRDPLR